MRITSKGQVTIPADIRAQAGLLPLTEVTFELVDGVVRLRPLKDGETASRGARIVDHLRGRMRGRWTTDQLMALTRGD